VAEAMGGAASSERSALRHKLPRALMLAWCVAAVPALAQSLDLGGNAAGQPASPGLDLDANAAAPVATTPSASEDSVKAGLVLRPLILPAPTDPVQNPAAPPENTPTTNAAEPLPIDHPAVLDTARLKAGDATIALFGIVGLPGDAAQGLREFIDKAGARVTCLQQASAEYICQLDDGTDVALVSLVNGAAQARADAPDAYHEQEAAAQAARRGIWASLPPPPVQVKHPSVRDTATLLADGKTYRLNGVVGLGGPYARELQGYIVAHDDSLVCQPQDGGDRYICVLSDGTDIAKVALVNGAAKVAADSPDTYRVQQGEAIDNRRGVWSTVTIAAAQAMRVVPPPGPADYPVVVGDEADGVTYVGGAPAAVIGGETVFLAFGGALGWGYYDHWHHWRGAPDRFRAHMEHFHPGGVGLRGYRAEGFRPAGFAGPHGGAPGAAHFAGPGGGAPHFAGGFMRPTPMAGGMGGFHAPIGGGFHAPAGGGFHPSVAAGGGGHHR